MTDSPATPSPSAANESQNKSHGRLAVRPTLRPRELMTNTPDLAGVWKAKVITCFPRPSPAFWAKA